MTVSIKPKYEIAGEYIIQYPVQLKATEPAIGAHLITPRSAYTHHGIYIGDNKVIHYSGLADGFSAGSIEETSLAAFEAGNGFSIKTYAHQHFHGQEVVDRARSRLGEDQYHLLFNNCEHFCEWCIDDKHYSEQIEQVKTASTQGLVAFTVLRAITPPQVSIPLSVVYGAYCWLQKDKN